MVKAIAVEVRAETKSISTKASKQDCRSQLSSLNDQIKNLSHFSAYLDGLADVTFLAPSNDALSTFFDSARGIAASSDPALLEAILTYHIQKWRMVSAH
jgi:uncharacterized surface protein with fasciclin (FAS1) repeats